MGNRVLVCIPSYRKTSALRRCLASVSGLSLEGSEVKTLVVDSGSDARELEGALSGFKGVELIKMDNRGYVGCVNAGLRYAIDEGFSTMVVLTDDAVAGAGLLAGLVPPLEADPKAAVCGCKILHVTSEGGAQRITVMRGAVFGRGPLPWSRMLPEGVSGPARCDWVNGAAVAMKLAVFREVGLLDESFFMYFDELDLGLKLRRAGYHALYVPEVEVVHESGSDFYGITSRGGGAYARYYLTRNVALLCYKRSPASLAIFLPYYVGAAFVRSAILVTRGRADCARAIMRGMTDFFQWNLGRGPY